jgi:hypothetical protein
MGAIMDEEKENRPIISMRYKGAWLVGMCVPALTFPLDAIISAQVGFVVIIIGLLISETAVLIAPLPRKSKWILTAITPLIWVMVILMLLFVHACIYGLTRD